MMCIIDVCFLQGCSICVAMTSHTIPSSTPTHCLRWMKSCKSSYKCFPFEPSSYYTAAFPSVSTPVRVFLHTERLTEELRNYLNSSCDGPLCVQLKHYNTVRDHVKNYVAKPEVKVWIGTEYTNYALYEIIKPAVCRHFVCLQLFIFHLLLMLCYKNSSALSNTKRLRCQCCICSLFADLIKFKRPLFGNNETKLHFFC